MHIGDHLLLFTFSGVMSYLKRVKIWVSATLGITKKRGREGGALFYEQN